VRLAGGAVLAEITPAPIYPQAWQSAYEALLELLQQAPSRTVRRWAAGLLEQHHSEALHALTLPRLRSLLRSHHDDVQPFAARQLKGKPGLEGLPLADWLDLLSVDNPEAIPLICDLVKANVHPDRLTLAQCAELARSAVAFVAELGLAWAKAKPLRTAEDLA